MCGICGYFGDGARISNETLERMNRTLARRGPDDSGVFREPGAGLAMRRLSIIDLSGGRQPIHNEDATVWVVFNGEIYNYRELRAALQQQGHRFETNTYAEVDGTLLFGSEIKAVLASGVVKRDLDYQALDAFFAFTYIPAPLTIYREVRKLEPGHLLVCESGRVEKRCYWDLDFANPDRQTDD